MIPAAQEAGGPSAPAGTGERFVSTNHSRQEERAFVGVKRAALAGLGQTELLRRSTDALRPAVPFEAYFAAAVDPSTLLITGHVAGVAGEIEGDRALALERAYFEEGLAFTSEMACPDRRARLLPAVTGDEVERDPRHRELRRCLGFRRRPRRPVRERQDLGGMEAVREAGDKDFTAREARLARRIAPLVGAGLRTAVLRREAGAEPTDGPPSPRSPGYDVPGVLSHTPNAGGLLSVLAGLDADPHSWQERDLPVPVAVVADAARRSLAPRCDRELHLVPRLRVKGNSGRWLTLHASVLESVDGRSGETVVVVEPTRPQELVRMSVAAHGLSPREEEVVKLVATGLTTRRISRSLYISEYTVQKHL